MKRLLDWAGAALLLAACAPLMLGCAFAIRLSSPGPILFRQRRLGLHGSEFLLYKFRTMHVDAPDLRNPDGSAFSSPVDPRVTPIGLWLRRSSLDELPQLFNVVRGEMSLVGPRPDQVDQIRFYSAEEKRKLAVKPGLTGLAQISGRNRICWKARKRLDVEYVDRHSLILDIQILLRTIPYVLLRRDIHSA